MKKLQRMLVSVVIILLALILTAALLIKLYGNQALKIGIEKASQTALKVNTRLEAVNLSILGGTLDLNNLQIDNPEGYEHPTFLKLGHGHMALNTRSLLSDTIVIDTMRFENIEVVIEQKGLGNNLKEILANLPKAEPAEPKPEEKAGKNVRVAELVIKDAKVKANLVPVEGLARASTVTIPLKEIRLENIGAREKVDTAELTSRILKAIAAGIAEQGKDLLPSDMIKSIGDQLSEQGLKLIESGKDLGTGLIEDVGKSATDALKGLLPGKKEE